MQQLRRTLKTHEPEKKEMKTEGFEFPQMLEGHLSKTLNAEQSAWIVISINKQEKAYHEPEVFVTATFSHDCLQIACNHHACAGSKHPGNEHQTT